MRKLFLFVLISIIGITFLNAHTYDELLSKGKAYEEKNEFIYALCYYFDALQIEDTDNEAKEKYDSLKSEILKGNPGYGEFSTLTIQKGWVNLLKNYYKYFTEYCPYDIYYGELELGNIDYETETAEYLLPYIYVHSEKYKEIGKIIETGIKESYRDDWGRLKHGNVPYLKLDDAESIEIALNEIMKIYKEEKIAFSGILKEKYNFSKSPAAFGHYQLLSYGGGQYAIDTTYYDLYQSTDRFCMYDVQFDIYDEEGNLLLSGQRQNCGYIYNNYSVENEINEILPKEHMAYKYSFIDRGAKFLSRVEKKEKIIIKPKNLFLNFGCISIIDKTKLYENKWDLEGNYSRQWSRQIFESLPSIQIPLSNVSFIDVVKYREDIKIAEQIEKKRKAEEQRKQRIHEFEITGSVSAEYVAETFLSVDTFPSRIKITGNIIDEWDSIVYALDNFNSSKIELDLSECKYLPVLKELSSENLIGIILPEGCKTINMQNCPNLISITLPVSIKYIDDNAFEKCHKLESINYRGSKKDWKEIEIGKQNNPIKKARITFDYKF